MSGEERREQLIAQEVESINQAVGSAEAGLLNLDKLTDDEVAVPDALPPPVTMPELERLACGVGDPARTLPPSPHHRAGAPA